MADMGRPLKFQTVAELDEKITDYFTSLTSRDVPTITGLAVYLDTNRATLLDYKDGKHDGKDEDADPDADFSYSIKKALAKCEAAIEGRAILGGLNATMSIFTLKNNYGWKDRSETDVTTGGDKLGGTVSADQFAQLAEARAGRADT